MCVCVCVYCPAHLWQGGVQLAADLVGEEAREGHAAHEEADLTVGGGPAQRADEHGREIDRDLEEVSTVEPQLKETPNKGNPRIKDKIRSTKTSLSYSANTFITSKERNLSIMNRITCPKSYVIQRFHCITL